MASRRIRCAHCKQNFYVLVENMKGKVPCDHCGMPNFASPPSSSTGFLKSFFTFYAILPLLGIVGLIILAWALSVQDWGTGAIGQYPQESVKRAPESKPQKREPEPYTARYEDIGFELTFPDKPSTVDGSLVLSLGPYLYKFEFVDLEEGQAYMPGELSRNRLRKISTNLVEESWRVGSTPALVVRNGKDQSSNWILEIKQGRRVFLVQYQQGVSALKPQGEQFLQSFRLLEGTDAGIAPEQVEKH